MRYKRIFIIALFVLLISTLILILPSCENNNVGTGITSVSIKKDKQTVELKASLDTEYVESNAKGKLYVMAIPTSDTENIPNDAEVLGEVKVKKNIKFKFSLLDGNGLSRLQKAYVIAEKNDAGYTAITNAMYIQNPEMLASGEFVPPAASDIKGLASEDAYRADLVGAQHKLIFINIKHFMLDEYEDGAVKYNRDGISYFFDGAQVEKYDEEIKSANELGIRVYIKTVNEYIPDIVSSSILSDITRVVPDMTDAEEIRRIDAFYAFLADRYSGKQGQVCDYIVGDSANEIRFIDGGKPKMPDSEMYEKLYFSWVRVAYNSLISINSGAKVYVPVSNAWRSESGNIISSKTFLSRFAENSKACGDYAWAIALDLGEADDLASLLSGNSSDYYSIGVSNLNELTELIDLASMRCNSKKRDFIIDSLDLPLSISESNRATYYICAYYRAAELGAKAFICTSDLNDKEGNRNALYYMFMLCGTEGATQLLDYTKKVEGFTSDRLEKYARKKLIYVQKDDVKYEISDNAAKNEKPLSVKLEGFKENGITQAHMAIKTNADGRYGRVLNLTANTENGVGAITAFNVDAKSVKTAKYIGITASSSNRPTMFLLVSNGSQKTPVQYVAEVQLANAETTYYFDISGLAERIEESDALDISVCVVSNDDVSEVSVSNIALYGSSGLGSEVVIIIILVVVALLALAGLVVFLAIRRKRKHTPVGEEV